MTWEDRLGGETSGRLRDAGSFRSSARALDEQLSEAVGALRDEQAVRSRVEAQVRRLKREREDLARRLDEHGGGAAPTQEGRGADAVEIDRLEDELRSATERMDVAAAEAHRSAKARDRAERRVAELEQALLGGAVTAPAAPVPPAAGRAGLAGRLPGRRGLGLVLGVCALAAAFAAGLLADRGDEVAGSAAAERTTGPRAFAPPLIPCDAIAPGSESRVNVVCGLRGRILHLGAGRRPLGLPDVTARVLDHRATASRVVVRVRLGNRTSQPQTVPAEPRNVYLAIGGRRVFGRSRAPLRLAPRGNGRMTLAFEAGTAALAAAASADLGVIGFGIDPRQRDQAKHVGAIRLPLTAPGAVAGS